MTALRSYVGGTWIGPADEGRPVLDAVTGEEVTRAHELRHRVGPAGGAQLAQDVLDVVLDRPLTHDERAGDRQVGVAARHQPDHL